MFIDRREPKRQTNKYAMDVRLWPRRASRMNCGKLYACDPLQTLGGPHPSRAYKEKTVRFRSTHILLATALSVLLVAVTSAGEPEDEVLASQGARFQAMIDEDIDALSQLLADGLHYSHTRGSVESKAQFLSTIESKRIDYLAATPRDIEVRLLGDTAVVTGLSDMKLIYRGEQLDFTIRFLEVSHKFDAEWQLVAWQSVRYAPD